IAAFELLFNHLAAAVEEKFNVAARGHVLLGSYLAGTALFNSSSGPCGGLSYPLGVQYKVPTDWRARYSCPTSWPTTSPAGTLDTKPCMTALPVRLRSPTPSPPARR